jgi:hypothetical protein
VRAYAPTWQLSPRRDKRQRVAIRRPR